MSRWPSFFSFSFFWAPVPNKATVSVDGFCGRKATLQPRGENWKRGARERTGKGRTGVENWRTRERTCGGRTGDDNRSNVSQAVCLCVTRPEN